MPRKIRKDKEDVWKKHEPGGQSLALGICRFECRCDIHIMEGLHISHNGSHQESNSMQSR